MAFAPDGETVASCDYSLAPSVRFWDVKTGRLLRAWKMPSNSVYRIAFSPDGKTLATASDVVRLWDIETGQERTTFEGHTHLVWDVAFSPDGRALATGSWDFTGRLWLAATEADVRSDVSRRVNK